MLQNQETFGDGSNLLLKVFYYPWLFKTKLGEKQRVWSCIIENADAVPTKIDWNNWAEAIMAIANETGIVFRWFDLLFNSFHSNNCFFSYGMCYGIQITVTCSASNEWWGKSYSRCTLLISGASFELVRKRWDNVTCLIEGKVSANKCIDTKTALPNSKRDRWQNQSSNGET